MSSQRVVGTLLILLLAGVASCTAAEPSSVPQPATPSSFTQNDVAHIEDGLTSRDPSVRRDVLAPEMNSLADDAHASQLFPQGAVMTVDAARFQSRGADIGVIPAVVTGGGLAGHWTLFVENQDGKWFVYGAVRA